MTKSDSSSVVPIERIENAILFIRGQKIMLDAALARLYGVSAKRLNEAVSRNRDRFPDDFIFQLTREKFGELTQQIDALKLEVADTFLMHSPSKVWRCFRVFCVVSVPSTSTSRSCGPLFV